MGWFGISAEKYVGIFPQNTKIRIFTFSTDSTDGEDSNIDLREDSDDGED